MIVASPPKSFTLAVHPTFAGFGWVVAEGPLSPHDWGVARIRIDKNSNILKRIERLIARFQPETLVLEAFEEHTSARRKRITDLCRAMVALARDAGVEIAVFSRGDIQSTFGDVGARSRHEIAEAVARHVPSLRARLPRKRRAWQSDHPNMSIFNAMAAALTHFRLSCDTLLDDLSADR